MNLCENIFVLNYGKIISEGTAKEVKKAKTVISAYLGNDQVD
jgi:branched-chain amino acid transport system ATP-binding protein